MHAQDVATVRLLCYIYNQFTASLLQEFFSLLGVERECRNTFNSQIGVMMVESYMQMKQLEREDTHSNQLPKVLVWVTVFPYH